MKTYLNGHDLQTVFKLDMLNVTDQMLQLPARKDSVSTDFADQNGIDIDLAAPKFKARPFAFKCIIRADTLEAFKQAYFRFWQLLKVGQDYQLYNDFIDMSVYIYFISQTNIIPLSRSTAGYSMTFTLNFGEREPFANLPIVELVNEDYAVLVP